MRAYICMGLLLAACGGLPGKSEDFMWSVRGYNDGIRWQRFDVAAGHVPVPERPAFLDERERLTENLRISDWEIKSVVFKADRTQARVEVRYDWHRDDEGIMKHTTCAQRWVLRGKEWFMTEELELRGDDMPGVDAPIEEDQRSAAGDVGRTTEM